MMSCGVPWRPMESLGIWLRVVASRGVRWSRLVSAQSLASCGAWFQDGANVACCTRSCATSCGQGQRCFVELACAGQRRHATLQMAGRKRRCLKDPVFISGRLGNLSFRDATCKVHRPRCNNCGFNCDCVSSLRIRDA